MTLRDKIMDKYWLEFIQSIDTQSTFEPPIVPKRFWRWFYDTKVVALNKELKDFV